MNPFSDGNHVSNVPSPGPFGKFRPATRTPAVEKAKEEVASRKAAARAQAQNRHGQAEHAKQQATVAKEKVQEFETFRARAIRYSRLHFYLISSEIVLARLAYLQH